MRRKIYLYLYLSTLFNFPIFFYANQAQNKVDTLDLYEQKKIILDKKLNENSGIQFVNDFIYTFNDSGGKPEVYKLSKDGTIIQTILLEGANNVDWEEITAKGDTLFIGDFGNNAKNRTDLVIYYFVIPNSNDENVRVFPERINFYFEENGQMKFYDCEAFVYYKGNLHLFSKEQNETSHYILSFSNRLSFEEKTEGKLGVGMKIGIEKVETFTTECSVTGADIYNDELYLTGYTNEGFVHLWKFSSISEDRFFMGKSEKIFLGLAPAIGQIEGITFDAKNMYISGEKFDVSFFHVEPTLYIIDNRFIVTNLNK